MNLPPLGAQCRQAPVDNMSTRRPLTRITNKIIQCLLADQVLLALLVCQTCRPLPNLSTPRPQYIGFLASRKTGWIRSSSVNARWLGFHPPPELGPLLDQRERRNAPVSRADVLHRYSSVSRAETSIRPLPPSSLQTTLLPFVLSTGGRPGTLTGDHGQYVLWEVQAHRRARSRWYGGRLSGGASRTCRVRFPQAHRRQASSPESR